MKDLENPISEYTTEATIWGMDWIRKVEKH